MGRVLFALIGRADFNAPKLASGSEEEDIGPIARACKARVSCDEPYSSICLLDDQDSNNYKSWLAKVIGLDEDKIAIQPLTFSKPVNEDDLLDKSYPIILNQLPDRNGAEWHILINSGFPMMRSVWRQLATLFGASLLEISRDGDVRDVSSPELPAYDGSISTALNPVIFVFDAYNSHTERQNGIFHPVDEASIQSASELFGCSLERIEIALRNHSRMLNELSAFFDVRAPRSWINYQVSKDSYSQVVTVLPLSDIALLRSRVAAFIVELEWVPAVNTSDSSGKERIDAETRLGLIVLQLLSRRFPEIPVFVRTGNWQLLQLQDGLANGSDWCFRKWATHQRFVHNAEGEPLTVPSLYHHLEYVAKSRYQALGETPYPDQLQLVSDIAKKLLDQLDIRLPLEKSERGRDFQKIVATLFPDGDEVRPVKLFGTGKSKAQATFVVRPSRNGVPFAPRFLKAAPWLEIEREYLAYQQVIRPRLGSYVANIVERPVMTGGNDGESPMGALVYSLAGLPEGYEDLKPLDELIRGLWHGESDVSKVKTRLQETLQEVLLPLYGEKDGESATKKKPLWNWLGEVLPPAFTGVLVPLADLDKDSSLTMESRKQGGLKDTTAWLMAACDTADLREKACGDEISPWNLGGEEYITLSGFILLEAEWGNDADTGEITLAHPDLGWRIRLRGKEDDIRRRFGAIWARPGMPVDVVVCIEKKNREVEKIKRKLQSSFDSVGIEKKNASWLEPFKKVPGRVGLSDPFDLFGEQGMPFSFTIPAHEAPIHGDLNLHNILFSGDSGPGWLIDFDRANLHGMPAFDLAKLEAEIWHHHLFPALTDIAYGADDKIKCCIKLLNAALTAVDASSPGEMFTTLVRTKEIVNGATDDLMLPVCNLLDIMAVVREFGRKDLKLGDAEFRWALASYLFTATKFAGGDDPWRVILSFFASAYHLFEVAPDRATTRATVFESLKSGDLKAADPRKVDGLLIGMANAPSELDKFTSEMAEFRNVPKIAWEKNTERWDLASTGSITNITPIFGYLWLMVKAEQSKQEDGAYGVVVPKISSKGASCGTVDILKAGGLSFPSDPEAIKATCKQIGGVLCEQHKDLTPVDKALMKRRKETNTMKNVALVYASILSKKIAVGCTHAIIDVKVGRDSKILSPWMDKEDQEQISLWLGLKVKTDGKLCPDMKSDFADLLKAEQMLGDKFSLENNSGNPWMLEQTCSDDLKPLRKVSWFFTNSDIPQCRTIGRQLTLLHLDELILGSYGETLLDDKTGEYYKLYKDILPKVCEVSSDLWEDVKEQWQRLKKQMPLMSKFAAKQFFKDKQSKIGFLSKKTFEQGIELDAGMNLKVMTLALSPYQLSAKEGQKVKRIKAWELDSLFDWLSAQGNFDPEIGIYLHRLPGEKIVSPDADPFISIFFRPSWTPEAEVLARARAFLSEHVELGENT